MLSDRQRQVAELLSQGYTMEEAAEEMGISHSAVKQHADVVKRKLGVKRSRQIGQAFRESNGD